MLRARVMQGLCCNLSVAKPRVRDGFALLSSRCTTTRTMEPCFLLRDDTK